MKITACCCFVFLLFKGKKCSMPGSKKNLKNFIQTLVYLEYNGLSDAFTGLCKQCETILPLAKF